jgi:hypothetical protein
MIKTDFSSTLEDQFKRGFQDKQGFLILKNSMWKREPNLPSWFEFTYMTCKNIKSSCK